MHLLSTERLKPDPEKVRAITEMLRPKNRRAAPKRDGNLP